MAFLPPAAPPLARRGRPPRAPARAPPTARVLPLRPAAVARIVPVLASPAQTAHLLGDRSAVLDRSAAAAAATALLLLLGAALPPLLRALLHAAAAALPLLVPFLAACARNARLRAHPHTALFLGTVAAPAPLSPSVTRLTLRSASGAASAPAPAAAAARARPGMAGFALVVADEPEFRVFRAVGELHVPDAALWASDGGYPYVRRRAFQQAAVAADLAARADPWPAGQ